MGNAQQTFAPVSDAFEDLGGDIKRIGETAVNEVDRVGKLSINELKNITNMSVNELKTFTNMSIDEIRDFTNMSLAETKSAFQEFNDIIQANQDTLFQGFDSFLKLISIQTKNAEQQEDNVENQMYIIGIVVCLFGTYYVYNYM